MHQALYITAAGPLTGKNAIALEIMHMLGRDKNAAFFRPVIDVERDPVIDLMRQRFGITVEVADAYGCTRDEARQLINAGKRGQLIETVLRKYKKLLDAHDFVLCLGTNFADRDAVTEFGLNAEIAANLGCPVLLVADGGRADAAAVSASLRVTLDSLKLQALDVAGVIVNHASFSAEELSAIRGQLSQGDKPVLFYAVPTPAGTINPDGKLFAEHVSGKELAARLQGAGHMTPKMFEFELIERARASKMRIVLAEGEEERILRATDILLRREVADIILLGDVDKIRAKAGELGCDVSRARLVDPVKSDKFEEYAAAYAEYRKKKGVTLEQARETLKDATYFATMMVKKDEADGMVSGAVNTTAHTIRPSFEFIKTKPGFSVVSSVFLMCLKDRVLVFGDCAVNPNPDPQQLAEIAVASARTARVFGIEPRVAMLSYSSGNSGKGADVDAVKEATRLAREMAPELALEGPLQYDAAIAPEVAATKMPGNPVAGKATVFIFPNLNAGNNGYKAVQRAADALAIGPVLQGLNKPVNDLSRGCTVPDIVNTVAITAVQAAAEKAGN